MKITILGSGAASGWPNPLCSCASCVHQRAQGKARTSSSAYVHGLGVMDWGPTTALRASQCGIDLSTVANVFITHAHPDHFDPQFLLWEQWATRSQPLRVWGPQRVIDMARRWTHSPTVELNVVRPGDQLDLGDDWSMIALAAHHDPHRSDEVAADTVLYSLRDHSGSSLLYATDTAAFTIPAEHRELLEECGHAPWRIIAMEETFGAFTDHRTGHHDIHTFATQLDYFSEWGLSDSRTRTYAIHLGHEHDPHTFEADLAALGSIPAVDGMTIGPGIHLILGGTRSGKSRFAQDLLAEQPDVLYVATGYPVSSTDADTEWAARVLRHQGDRPDHWRTVETIDIAAAITSVQGAVIVDCLGLWLTRTIDELEGWESPSTDLEARVLTSLRDVLSAARSHSHAVVFVGNDVGASLTPTTHAGRVFQDLMGMVNRSVAEQSDRVTYMIAGQPLMVKP